MAPEDRTYAEMALNLGSVRYTPKPWDKPLKAPLVLDTRWVGHYSCLHPWPKTAEELEEFQSCAEDWNDHTNPLVGVETLIGSSL